MDDLDEQPREAAADGKAIRQFKLHAQFTPGGPDLADSAIFMQFCFSGLTRTLSLKDKKLAPEQERAAKNQDVLKARSSFYDSLKVLDEQVAADSAEAAEALADMAFLVVSSLQIKARQNRSCSAGLPGQTKFGP